jgi:hypothetical protein
MDAKKAKKSSPEHNKKLTRTAKERHNNRKNTRREKNCIILRVWPATWVARLSPSLSLVPSPSPSKKQQKQLLLFLFNRLERRKKN